MHRTAHPLTFAVVTSTIGRSELEEAILSVQNQTYPAKHYVIVDGKEFWQQANTVLLKYPNVVPIYLPMNTGKNGWFNSRINAFAPFLVEEDIICFLGDDNFYSPNHIETLAEAFHRTSADWAFSLRNMIRMDGSFICQDRAESIGFYRSEPPQIRDFYFGGSHISMNMTHETLVDVNTYAFRRELAYRLGMAWNIQGFGNDRVIFSALKNEPDLKYVCTDCFTVNYRINPKTFSQGYYWEIFSNAFPDLSLREEAIYMLFKTWMENSQIIKE